MQEIVVCFLVVCSAAAASAEYHTLKPSSSHTFCRFFCALAGCNAAAVAIFESPFLEAARVRLEHAEAIVVLVVVAFSK